MASLRPSITARVCGGGEGVVYAANLTAIRSLTFTKPTIKVAVTSSRSPIEDRFIQSSIGSRAFKAEHEGRD